MVTRNPQRRKTRCGEASVRPSGLVRPIMLGVPGRPWAAHVVMLGAVGIERCNHELAQEIDDLPDQAGIAGARCGAH